MSSPVFASHPPLKHHVAPVAIGLVVLFAFVALFTSALHDPRPIDLEVAVVGDEGQIVEMQHLLDTEMSDAFELVGYEDREAATVALKEQDVEGVFIASPTSPEVLTASADGFAVTEVVRSVFTRIGGPQTAVHDVVPLPDHDSKGLSAFLAVAGTTVGSLIFSAVLFLVASRTSVAKRFGLICAFGLLAGLLAAVDTRFVAHGLDRFWAVAGILTLVSLAVALTTAGVVRLVGAPGIGLCLLVLAFTALPASGGPLGYQFLPDFYHSFAQALPSTAGVSALRGAVYFDGAHTTGPIAVLVAWSLGGVALYALARVLRPAHPHPPMIGVPPRHAEALRRVMTTVG
jgi:hypothetical protein